MTDNQDQKKSDKSEPSGNLGLTLEVEPSPQQENTSEKTQNAKTSKSKPDNPDARWYVVHTYSGHEAKVATTLKQRIDSQKLSSKVIDILVPTQNKIEIKEGKKT